MPGRILYALVAACWGAAIALLVYRFAVMPPVWSAPVAKVFELGPPALAVVSWVLRQLAKGRRWPWPSMVAALILSFGAVMLIATLAVPGPGRAELVARSLPGMTVSLPSGKEERARLDYGSGELVLSKVAFSGGVISITWSPGTVGDDEAKALSIAAAGVAEGTGRRVEKWPGPGDAPTLTMLVETPKGTLIMSILSCGKRRVFLNSVGNEELFRRVLRSFVCQPDPAKDQALGGLPWTLALPEGWKADDETGSVFYSEQGVVSVQRMSSDPSPDNIRKIMTLVFTSEGAQAVIGELSGDRFPLEVTEPDGAKMIGWIRWIPCPQGSVLVVSFASTETTLAAVDQVVKEQGRCLKQGEPAPRWPAR